MSRPRRIRNPATPSFRCERTELELIQAFGLNLSQICRAAIQDAIGQKILENQTNNCAAPELLEEYIEILRERKLREEEFYDDLSRQRTKRVVMQPRRKRSSTRSRDCTCPAYSRHSHQTPSLHTLGFPVGISALLGD